MAERGEQHQKDQDKENGRDGKRTSATERSAEAGGEAMRSGGRAARQGMHLAGQAAARTGEAAAGVAHVGAVGAHAVGRSSREIIDKAADHAGELSRSFAESAQRTSEDLRLLMSLPGLGGGFECMQQGVSGMVNRLLEANVKATQEVFESAHPGRIMELQQRFARRVLYGMIEGSAEMLRISRQLADQALQPIEERVYRYGDGGSRHEHGRGHGRVADVMSQEVQVARPDQTVQEAARMMAEMDAGTLPVGENDRLVGMITDRDIAVRVTAEGRDPKQTRVRDVMSQGVRYCFDDEDIDHVAENMAEQQVRRMPVVNRDKRLVGVISLGDIAATQPTEMSGSALRGVSQGAGGRQSQARERAYAGNKPRRPE